MNRDVLYKLMSVLLLKQYWLNKQFIVVCQVKSFLFVYHKASISSQGVLQFVQQYNILTYRNTPQKTLTRKKTRKRSLVWQLFLRRKCPLLHRKCLTAGSSGNKRIKYFNIIFFIFQNQKEKPTRCLTDRWFFWESK